MRESSGSWCRRIVRLGCGGITDRNVTEARFGGRHAGTGATHGTFTLPENAQ